MSDKIQIKYPVGKSIFTIILAVLPVVGLIIY